MNLFVARYGKTSHMSQKKYMQCLCENNYFVWRSTGTGICDIDFGGFSPDYVWDVLNPAQGS